MANNVLEINPHHSASGTSVNLRKALAEMFLVFRKHRLTEEEQIDEKVRLSIYMKHLTDLSPQLVSLACQRLTTTSKFLPSIAEIREVAAVIESAQNGIGYDNPWEKIRTSSIAEWAKNVARAYGGSTDEQWQIGTQATKMALNNGQGEVGLAGSDKFWDGEQCLQAAGDVQ